MASSGGKLNTSISSQPSFSDSSTKFMFNDLIGNINNSESHFQGVNQSRVRNEIEIPKSNSFWPSNTLAIFPSTVPPSSDLAIPLGLGPSGFLDSPAFLSNSYIVSSPTSGAFAGHDIRKERDYSDFSFKLPQTGLCYTSSSSMFLPSSNPSFVDMAAYIDFTDPD